MKAQHVSKRAGKRRALALAAPVVIAAAVPLLAWAQGTAAVPSEDDAASAVGCLRTINTAEVTYASTYDKGFSVSLKSLGGSGDVKPTPSAAYLVDESLAGGTKSNYIFTYKAGKPDKDGKTSTYQVTARPARWAKGVKSFFTDQTGVIRWTDENRAPRASDRPLE